GLLEQLATSSVLELLLHPDEASWERPASLERLQATLDEQQLEPFAVKTEDNTVDGERRPWMFIREGHQVSPFIWRQNIRKDTSKTYCRFYNMSIGPRPPGTAPFCRT